MTEDRDHLSVGTTCPHCKGAGKDGGATCSMCWGGSVVLLRRPFMQARIDGRDLLICETARAVDRQSFGYTVWTHLRADGYAHVGQYVAEGASIEDARAKAAGALVAPEESAVREGDHEAYLLGLRLVSAPKGERLAVLRSGLAKLGLCALLIAGACAPARWTPTPAACWPGAHPLTEAQDEACELAADLDYDRGAR